MEEQEKDFIDLTAITERLFIIRNKFEGTDKEFSEKTGISRSRLSEAKNGKTTLSISDVNMIIRLCPELISSPEYFIFGRRLSPTLAEEDLRFFSEQEEAKQIHLIKRVEELAEENTKLKIERESLAQKLREANHVSKKAKEISEIKVYYTNNSFETYKPKDHESIID